jgi:hypothetical protein
MADILEQTQVGVFDNRPASHVLPARSQRSNFQCLLDLG